MKRSSAITLVALGVGAVALQTRFSTSTNTDSDSPRDDGAVFASKEQCASAGTIDKADCEKGWNEAQKDHEASAPHYGTMADCEKVYGAGKCTTPTTTAAGSAAGYVIPAMMGYMIGRSWSGAGCRAAPLYRRPNDPKDQYLFTAGTCAAYGSSGSSGGSSRGTYGGGSSGYRSTYTRATTTRGGFGSAGRGFSSHSGS